MSRHTDAVFDSAPCRRLLSDFRRDQQGGVTIFVLVLMTMLLVVGGMAVDYQRHEALRADLQDALDRGSLAAANLNQSYLEDTGTTVAEQASAVVREYMASRNFRSEAITVTANVRNVGGGREVTATASTAMSTIFLSLVGIDALTVNASSIATHAAQKLEIVLVLDITGSMTWSSQSGQRKIDDLKIAAKEFLDTVLADSSGSTLISIVPFSQNVNLPRAVADLYNIDRRHDYASCIDYHEFDFTTTAMPVSPAIPYKQAQHFRSDVGSGNFGCPKTNNAATVYSNNLTDLKAAIDAITPETWTATYMGMKWGAALLDPASGPIVSTLVSNGSLPSRFEGWPLSWDDQSVRKIVVLMSDGGNTRLNEIYDDQYDDRTPEWWNDNDPGGARYSVINSEATGEGDTILAQICTATKTRPNAIVYSIGFEVDDYPTAQAALLGCATGITTYYLVEGVEISTAFQNIADEISNLKLTN